MASPTSVKRRVLQAESSSVVILQDSPDSGTASQSLSPAFYTGFPVITASVALRRSRLALVTFTAIASIVGVTLLFLHGLELGRFNASDKNAKQQSQLLDDYNSYSGNVASVLSKFAEIFIGLAVQVTALYAFTAAFIRPEPSWKARSAAALASAVIGYLIGNSFNALNVQLRELPVQAAISSSDLSSTDATASNDSSNVTHSVAESTARNSIANTVLRTLVQPRAAIQSPSVCSWSLTTQNYQIFLPNDVLKVGFPQREWMTRLLPEALEASTLRFTLNATNTSANAEVRGEDLSMDASLAADLVVNTMFLSSEFIPWGKNAVWNDQVPTDVADAYPTSASQSQRQVPTAALLKLLPADPVASESTKRKWLLEAIEPILSSKFDTGDFSPNDISVEFTHVDLAPNITFDALTFEVDVDPSLITNSTDESDGTRHTWLNANFNCGPWHNRCLFPKAVLTPRSTALYYLLYDAPVQVNAFAVCMNSDGSETIQSTIHFNESSMIEYNFQPCSNISSTSTLLVSVAKRLVADELVSNISDDSLATSMIDSAATNLRKIYSFTVGRLHWNVSDLADDFNAVCLVDGGDCSGLSVELNASDSQPEQRLVAGVNALPLNLLTAPNYNGRLHTERQRALTLIQVDEPPRQSDGGGWYSIIAGDMLLPHNVGLGRWHPGSANWSEQLCALQEDRVQLVINNHYYMEHTLQATYTSALFFLLQDGVTTDTMPSGQGRNTLAFGANVQPLAVWISVPGLNAWLTVAGCVVLAAGLTIVVLLPRFGSKEDPLSGISTPHGIARVMLDQHTFPPELLHRQVHLASEALGESVSRHSVDALVIQELSVRPKCAGNGLVGIASDGGIQSV